MVFLTPERIFGAFVRENWFMGMGCSILSIKKIGNVGNLPNVITNAKMSNRLK